MAGAVIWELVRSTETRAIGLPEIQRKYRWDRAKARALADSLYRRFPVGGLTLWKPANPADVVSRVPGDAGRTPDAWVIDGASRLTTLCTLFGTHPYWGTHARLQDPVQPAHRAVPTHVSDQRRRVQRSRPRSPSRPAGGVG